MRCGTLSNLLEPPRTLSTLLEPFRTLSNLLEPVGLAMVEDPARIAVDRNEQASPAAFVFEDQLAG
jgi:hypothetical protein